MEVLIADCQKQTMQARMHKITLWQSCLKLSVWAALYPILSLISWCWPYIQTQHLDRQ